MLYVQKILMINSCLHAKIQVDIHKRTNYGNLLLVEELIF